jgi:oligogalacturonide lyase
MAGHGTAAEKSPAVKSTQPGSESKQYEWTDPATGYRIVQLTRRPGPNMSFYFHNNPFVAGQGGEGDLMLFYGATDEGTQLFRLNLKTLETRQLTHQTGRIRGEIISPKLREAFFQNRSKIFAVNIDTGKEREVATLAAGSFGGISTVNSDGTLLAGTFSPGRREILDKYPRKADYFNRIYDANLPSQLFTLDLSTGKVTIAYEEAAWLNHLQFSPTNPNLLMYCHEGPWHKLQRIWLIDLTNRNIRKVHERTVDREIAGHEFWSPDGRTIWFDLQIPRGETFYLAGYDLAADRETRYLLKRNEWSVHYNISSDEKLFCGDGGGRSSVAHSDNGQWIYLFQPDGDRLRSTRLADLGKHNYDLEPNAHFTPNGRQVVFRSNMHGSSQIYAVVLK